MSEPRSSDATTPPGSIDIGGDWPAQAADTIVRVVDQVRDKTTDKVITVSRLVVYGLMASFLGLFALVIVLILAVRIPSNYIPGDVYWIELGWGLILTVLGLFVFSKRTARP
jgi:O-antigen/teichoic acid export membrane protein